MASFLKSVNTFNSDTSLLQQDERYTIILNSNLGSGALNNVKTFNFDWSVIPDRNYEVHFNFNSMPMSLTWISQPLCMIYSDLFAGGNVYMPGTTNGAATTQALGIAFPYVQSATSFIHAEDNSTPPIFINSRPCLNQFTISLLTNANPPVPFNPFSGAGVEGTMVPWVLMIDFVPVDKPTRMLL
jgi:hypothetical protein